MSVPSGAPAVVTCLTMRGSRTVQEIADAAGITVSEAVHAVRWLRSNRFLEYARVKNPDGGYVEMFSIGVVVGMGKR